MCTDTWAVLASVKGGDAAEEAAVLSDFKLEIEAVAADPQYDDVPASYVAPAALAVSTEPAQARVETTAPTPASAPTPAPTHAGGGGGSPVGAVVGAVAGVAALAGVALWQRKKRTAAASTGARAAMASGGAPKPADNPTLHDIYPDAGSAAPGGDKQTKADQADRHAGVL